ncbi:spermatogenesis-associated protein 6 isoform X2 [Esox lucius]|uniref:spermatogenesis-associated protein 6 isoform X2 n=1 Tax=Esox lucius TaxID=8010 RepID=UPI0009731BB0|nr:spermatogenesis-associated protein 6 isoform X2 [Esox lucius]
MGGLTQKNKPSSSNMFQRSLKCTVKIEIQTITCPGVVLPNQEDVYLSVCIMGQFKKTRCLPPVFPLLFHEKMIFMKTFSGVADPGQIANLLEADTTSFELIQLVPPEGDSLATIEENTRDFLYPGPRLTTSPRAAGPGREMLMSRSVSFPGISPKVEFASTSIIEECDWTDRPSQPQLASPPCCSPSSAKWSPGRQRPEQGAVGIPKKPLKGKELNRNAPSSGYRKPTVASQTRSPSPYTHRRMCQLSEEARQRLSHFHLGPHRFKKETEPQVPFVVSRTASASMIETPSRFSPSKMTLPHSRSTSFAADRSDNSSLLGSYRPVRKSPGKSFSTPVRVARSALAAHCSTPAAGPRSPQLSPLLSRSSLRERFHTAFSPSDEIHSRVQKVLHTHGADRKLHFFEMS